MLDCTDADALAPFWCEALGYSVRRHDFPYVALGDPAGALPELLLQQVPESKRGKNRMHLDLRVAEPEPDLGRLLGLGAGVARGPFDGQGWLTVVLTDPQGNESCLIRTGTPRTPRTP